LSPAWKTESRKIKLNKVISEARSCDLQEIDSELYLLPAASPSSNIQALLVQRIVSSDPEKLL